MNKIKSIDDISAVLKSAFWTQTCIKCGNMIHHIYDIPHITNLSNIQFCRSCSWEYVLEFKQNYIKYKYINGVAYLPDYPVNFAGNDRVIPSFIRRANSGDSFMQIRDGKYKFHKLFPGNHRKLCKKFRELPDEIILNIISFMANKYFFTGNYRMSRQLKSRLLPYLNREWKHYNDFVLLFGKKEQMYLLNDKPHIYEYHLYYNWREIGQSMKSRMNSRALLMLLYMGAYKAVVTQINKKLAKNLVALFQANYIQNTKYSVIDFYMDIPKRTILGSLMCHICYWYLDMEPKFEEKYDLYPTKSEWIAWYNSR